MCNLTELTKRKTVVVYKTAVKVGENYYSFFAGTKIEIGKVKKQTNRISDVVKHRIVYRNFINNYRDHIFFNPHMVGRCSGFKNLTDAKILGKGRHFVVLKIVLGGEIWIGDASDIDPDIPNDHIIYAGTEILSAVEWWNEF